MPANSRAWLWTREGKGITGFIELRHSAPRFSRINELTIVLVHRPLEWGEKIFCSVMLPAAIRDLYEAHGELVIERLDRVTVAVVAKPYVTACKCYIRTMAAMGFTHVAPEPPIQFTELVPLDEDGIERFCADAPIRTAITAYMDDPEVKPHFPYVAAESKQKLETSALVVDTFLHRFE